MINIKFTADPLQDDFSGTLQDFQTQFLTNLRGTISETQVLVGQVGGVQPLTNIGPWLNNDTWFYWNGVEYVPMAVRVGAGAYTVKIGDNTTVGDSKSLVLPDFTQTLQDKDGTIALLSDVYVGRPAVVLTGTTPTIDWSQGHHFTETLSGNTTIKMSNMQDGQRITVKLANSGTSYTVTWPSYVFWPSTTPTQTALKTDIYTFRNIGGTIIGRQVPNY